MRRPGWYRRFNRNRKVTRLLLAIIVFLLIYIISNGHVWFFWFLPFFLFLPLDRPLRRRRHRRRWHRRRGRHRQWDDEYEDTDDDDIHYV